MIWTRRLSPVFIITCFDSTKFVTYQMLLFFCIILCLFCWFEDKITHINYGANSHQMESCVWFDYSFLWTLLFTVDSGLLWNNGDNIKLTSWLNMIMTSWPIILTSLWVFSNNPNYIYKRLVQWFVWLVHICLPSKIWTTLKWY